MRKRMSQKTKRKIAGIVAAILIIAMILGSLSIFFVPANAAVLAL